MTPPTSPDAIFDVLAGYPRWLVTAGLTVLAAVAIWILIKLLKWSLEILLVLVLVGGAAATLWFIFN